MTGPRSTAFAGADGVPGSGSDLAMVRGLAMVLHAAGSSPRALTAFASALTLMAGRVDIPALTVHDASLESPGPAPFAAAVAMVRERFEREATARPRLLVGHSMGGLIALLALADGLAVDAAVLYEPIVLDVLDRADPADRVALEWDAACIERFRACCVAGDPEPGVASFIEAYGELPWSALPARVRADLVARAPSLLAEAIATNAQRLDRQRLGQLALPILILDGNLSPPITTRMAARLASVLPNARRHTIEGAGHMAPVVAPDAVIAAIGKFLRQTGAIALP